MGNATEATNVKPNYSEVVRTVIVRGPNDTLLRVEIMHDVSLKADRVFHAVYYLQKSDVWVRDDGWPWVQERTAEDALQSALGWIAEANAKASRKAADAQA